MFKFLQKNFSGLFVVFVLAVCVWLFTHRGSNRFYQATNTKTTTLDIWLPVQKTVTYLLGLPENIFNAIQELRNLRQEVGRLQQENQSLRLELSNHHSLESEVARLKQILQLKARLPHLAKIAHIIAHDPSTWNKSFVIDLGSDDGVEPDSPVISEQGIVGRVLETTPKYSRVLLLSDKESSISGIDQRSQVTGVVLGTGRYELRLGYVSANEDIQKDDIIVSSGLGGVYPKGYTIGTVTKRTESENGLNTEIEVVPAVDFAALDYVFVIPPINVYE